MSRALSDVRARTMNTVHGTHERANYATPIMRVLSVAVSALAVLPLFAQADVSEDVQNLIQQCTGLDFGSWNEYVAPPRTDHR